MARALVEYARVRGVKPSSEVRNFNLIPGGIAGFVDDCYVKIGNAEVALSNGWLRESNSTCLLSETVTQKSKACSHLLISDELRDNEAGITISYVGMVDRCIGYFCLGDQLREEAARAVQELKVTGPKGFGERFFVVVSSNMHCVDSETTDSCHCSDWRFKGSCRTCPETGTNQAEQLHNIQKELMR